MQALYSFYYTLRRDSIYLNASMPCKMLQMANKQRVPQHCNVCIIPKTNHISEAQSIRCSTISIYKQNVPASHLSFSTLSVMQKKHILSSCQSCRTCRNLCHKKSVQVSSTKQLSQLHVPHHSQSF